MPNDELRDRIAILDLLARYTHSGDRGRIDELAACFADDGILEFPGGRGIGRVGIVAALSGGEANPSRSFVRHHVAMPIIEVDGSTARVRSYFTVVSDDGPDHSGTYTDRLVRKADGWRFAERRVRVDWQATTSLFRRMATRSPT